MTDSLITKYRPKKFSEVIGQGAIVRSLEANLAKKTSHTYLFSGPPGTGKTTLGRLVAEAVGCLGSDLIEVDGASKTGIDDMRAIIEPLMYRPMGGSKAKVVLVDEAQGLSKSAVTSLLKATEEPPAWCYWVLCTTEPTKIPEALRTRSSHYTLKPVSLDDLTHLLDKVVGSESLDLDEPIIDLCAKEANGSPRQALSNLAVCAEAKDLVEAKELLRSAIETEEAVALARALVSGAGWSEIQRILNEMKDVSPESARHVVRAYVTAVILKSNKESQVGRCLEILSNFSEPFHSFDGISPLVLSCGQSVLGR